MIKNTVLGLIMIWYLFLAGCEQSHTIRERIPLTGEVVVEDWTEKIDQKAILVDLTNTKIEYKSLWKIWTEKTTAVALDMDQFLFSWEDHSKICSSSCWWDYWYKHSIYEGPWDICENHRIVLPEYWIKIFSWGWAWKEKPLKEKFINHNTITLDILNWGTGYETISIYKIPSGQSFKQTLEKTRPETKNFEKYEKKEIHSNNGDVAKWYDWFGKNINTNNPEDFEIYRVGNDRAGGNKLFFWFKEQANIFFVYDNYNFEISFPMCPYYLIDTIEEKKIN